MKINIGRGRDRGLACLAAFILGMIVIIIGAEIIYVLVKACRCIQPKNTNDPPDIHLVIDGPATKAFNGPSWVPPQGAITLYRSAHPNMSNSQPIFFMTVTTNDDGTLNITTYNSFGQQVGTRNFNHGEAITNEVSIEDPLWPMEFYSTNGF